MGDGPQAHLLPWFDRPPDAETARADRHPAQTSWVSCNAVKRFRHWRHQRPADRHASPSRRGRHPACLSRARDRRDPLRRAVIISLPRPRATPACRTTILPTRCGRDVAMSGPRYTSFDNACRDSRRSAVMTTCSMQEAVERTCVKRHKPLEERVEKARNSAVSIACSNSCRGLLGQSLGHLPAKPLPQPELRASLVADAVMCWPIQSDGAQVTATP